MAKITLTKRTRKFRLLSRLFHFISWLCLVCPLAWFAIAGFMENNAIYEKFAVCGTLLVAGIIAIVCYVNRVIMKSKIWLIVLAMAVVLDTFLPILIFTAICEVLNEIIITPLYNHCHDVYIANLEQDRRLP